MVLTDFDKLQGNSLAPALASMENAKAKVARESARDERERNESS